MPSATSASGDRGKKDRKEDKERKRSHGRSKTRERRSKRSRDSRKRHGDRRRRRTSSPQRHDSPQPPKPVLTPAAPATAEAEGTKEPAAAPSGSYVEEEVESESKESDAEIPDPVAPTANKAESEPAAARTELAAARSDGPTANKAESEPAARRGETEAAKAAAPAAPPMTMAKAVPPPQPANRPGIELALAKASPAKAGNPGARRPPEPQRPPQNWDRSRSASAGSTADKSGKYSCEVCGRLVGGGVAGAFQHRKSGYHLAAFKRCIGEITRKPLGASAWWKAKSGLHNCGKTKTSQGQKMKRSSKKNGMRQCLCELILSASAGIVGKTQAQTAVRAAGQPRRPRTAVAVAISSCKCGKPL